MVTKPAAYGAHWRGCRAQFLCVAVCTLVLVGCSHQGDANGDRSRAATSTAIHSPDTSLGDGGGRGNGWQVLLQRPLRIPAMPAHARCPVTTARTTHKSGSVSTNVLPGLLVGDGPAFPGFGGALRAGSTVQMMPTKTGWLAGKILWAISRRYHGDILIRGHQINGLGGMRFAGGVPIPGTRSDGQLAISARAGPAEASNFFVPRPGCYAFQLDGQAFSRIITIRVVKTSQ